MIERVFRMVHRIFYYYMLKKIIPRSIGFYLNMLALFAPRKSGEKALQIFSTPRKGKLKPEEKQYLAGFEKVILYHNGMPLQCYRKGNGNYKILLLHGWESNSARWERLISYLEKENHFTIIAMDSPAHGGSGGVEYDSIVHALCIDRVYNHFKPDAIIGHSIGAGSIVYGMSNIRHYPISKLVLMGSPNVFAEIIQTYTQVIKLNQKGQQALQQAILRKYNMTPNDYDISRYVSQIHCRGLVIHDTEDAVSVVQNAHHIAGNYKNADLFITTGFGHSLQHPVIFSRIAGFLKNGY
jgi:pimeloyl-ACP methyl ester carboxylesterase